MNSFGKAVDLHSTPIWVSPIEVASLVKLGTTCLENYIRSINSNIYIRTFFRCYSISTIDHVCQSVTQCWSLYTACFVATGTILTPVILV